MPRRSMTRLVIEVIRHKGPLTDAELAWWVRVVLTQNPETAKKKRRELTKLGIVRFAQSVKVTESGHVQKRWELDPQLRRASNVQRTRDENAGR